MPKFNLSALTLITLTLVIVIGCNDPSEEPSQNETDTAPTKVVQVDLQPVWDAATSPTTHDIDSESFYLFWDRSIPIGGYIHQTNQDDRFNLQRIHESLLNAHLLSNNKHGEVQCRAITDLISPFDCDTRLLSRNFFDGTDSRLDKAVDSVIEALTSGSLSLATLITDLVVTAESGNQTVIGAHLLRQYFNQPAIRGAFNEGKLHVAILGIKTNYWGVQAGVCRNLQGSLGCWYDEGDRRYKRLNDVAQRPIYVLILGRNTSGTDDNLVNKFTQKIHELLSDHGFDAIQYELITTGALRTPADFEWNPIDVGRGRPPVDLDPQRGYSCNEDKPHMLKANFIDSGVSIDEIVAQNFGRDHPEISIQKYENHEMSIRLDCKSVRDEIDKDRSRQNTEKICTQEETVNPSLTSVQVKLRYDQPSDDWSAWSSRDQRVDATPFLTEFIESIRPSYYLATISPFPPLDCN